MGRRNRLRAVCAAILLPLLLWNAAAAEEYAEDETAEEFMEETGEEDAEEDASEEEITAAADEGAAEGNSKSQERLTHGRSRAVILHGYGQVRILLDSEEDQQPMHALTLAGEELPLSLENAEGEAREFTLAKLEWSPELMDRNAALRAVTGENQIGAAEGAQSETAENEKTEMDAKTQAVLRNREEGQDGADSAAQTGILKEDPHRAAEETPAAEQKGNTLVLTAVTPGGAADPEILRWKINGAALRVLKKSGADYLAFRQGDRAVLVPTEGFLAGWKYDELKSRGTAQRRFDYTLILGREKEEPVWQMTVEGKEYDLGSDPLAPIYLTGIYTDVPEILNLGKEE